MSRTFKTSRVLLIAITIFAVGCFETPPKAQQKTFKATNGSPKNIILMIGDGMGFEQVKAAGMYKNAVEGTLSFEQLPYKGQVTTFSANKTVTDSAASATAMATGVKVDNGVISQRIPGDKTELKTLLEIYQDKGKAVGLVSTAYISHATPAGFAAHESARGRYKQIIQDYLTQTQPDLLMGGAKHVSPKDAEAAGYKVVTDRNSLLAIDTEKAGMIWGQFGNDHLPYEADGIGNLPHLSDMTKAALNILDNDPDGFFMMIESGRIDHSGHSNKIKKNVFETLEFAKAVELVLNWAKGRSDTLVVVTADHETGGLRVVENNGKDNMPKVKWTTGGHTGVNVPVYAWGMNADNFTGVLDNTDIFWLVQNKIEVPASMK